MRKEIEEEVKELVIERLKFLPENIKVSVGNSGSYNKEELIKHIKEGDDIGKKIIEVELHFLKALKEGILSEPILGD